MKVKELIEQLKTQDPEAMVVVRGYEGGFSEVDEIGKQSLKLNVHTDWYYGEHDEPRDYMKETEDCVAVLIG